MKAEIDQIQLDISTLEYFLYMTIDGDQFIINCSHAEAKNIIERSKGNFLVSKVSHSIYYIFENK